jgi:hypothetical protein
VLGYKGANLPSRFGGKVCGQQIDGAKGTCLVRNGDLCLFEIAPHLRGDEADQETEDDAERRQHPGREPLEGTRTVADGKPHDDQMGQRPPPSTAQER